MGRGIEAVTAAQENSNDTPATPPPDPGSPGDGHDPGADD